MEAGEAPKAAPAVPSRLPVASELAAPPDRGAPAVLGAPAVAVAVTARASGDAGREAAAEAGNTVTPRRSVEPARATPRRSASASAVQEV